MRRARGDPSGAPVAGRPRGGRHGEGATCLHAAGDPDGIHAPPEEGPGSGGQGRDGPGQDVRDQNAASLAFSAA